MARKKKKSSQKIRSVRTVTSDYSSPMLGKRVLFSNQLESSSRNRSCELKPKALISSIGEKKSSQKIRSVKTVTSDYTKKKK